MWLRKRTQNFLSPNSGHTRCPPLPPIHVNSHHHRASTATTTTSRVNGQPHVVPIYQVCFVFVFFLSTNAIITSSSTRVHPHPPPAPIRAHLHLSPVAPTHAPPVHSPTSNPCVSVMEGQQAQVIKNSEGACTAPSMVAFTEHDDRLISFPARHQAVINPSNSVFP